MFTVSISIRITPACFVIDGIPDCNVLELSPSCHILGVGVLFQFRDRLLQIAPCTPTLYLRGLELFNLYFRPSRRVPKRGCAQTNHASLTLYTITPYIHGSFVFFGSVSEFFLCLNVHTLFTVRYLQPGSPILNTTLSLFVMHIFSMTPDRVYDLNYRAVKAIIWARSKDCPRI